MRVWAVMGALACAGPVCAEQVSAANAVRLRGLDKMAGAVVDLVAVQEKSLAYGRLNIVLNECRYPTRDPSSNAYAHLTIKDVRYDEVVFEGWMIASAPALNALDHPRYDVWVLRCMTSSNTSDGDTSGD